MLSYIYYICLFLCGGLFLVYRSTSRSIPNIPKKISAAFKIIEIVIGGTVALKMLGVLSEIIACILLILCTVAYFTVAVKITLKKAENDKETKENEEKIRQQQICLSFYKKCTEKRIDENNEDGLRIIAEELSIAGTNTPAQQREMFLEGKKVFNENKLLEAKKNEMSSFETSKKDLDIAYHDKYLHGANFQPFYQHALSFGALSSLVHYESARLANEVQEHDSLFRGAVATGVAGPLAGVAEVVHTENENARNRQIRREAQERANDTTYLDYQRKVDRYKRFIDRFKDKLCDKGSVQQKYELIKFYDWKMSIKDTGNIELKGKVELLSDVTIAGRKGILDGCFKVDIINAQGQPVAEGIYFPPGFGSVDTYNEDLPKGFGSTAGTIRDIDITCITKNGMQLNSTDGLHCQIYPDKMWTIEYFESVDYKTIVPQ